MRNIEHQAGLRQGARLKYFSNMEQITDLQCRMARAALNWSTRELAKRSHVGATTIARFESGKRSNPSTLALLKQAFEAAGIEFTNGKKPGVRLRKQDKE
jgi:transcriptional regulator with XRE-family HTH domain